MTQKDYSDAMRPVWKEQKRRKMRIKRELSLDWLQERGQDIEMDGPLVHEIIEDKQLLDSLLAALDRLNDTEYKLIHALFYQNKTERELSRETGTPRKTLAYRRAKILAKLRELLENL